MKVDHIKVSEVLLLDKADITYRADGALIAAPRVGRIGIQLYQGKELGKPDMEVVRVYRPENEVMDKTAMASLTHRPVTNDHPSEPVTADNWKKYAVGHTGDTVARDGEFIRVPMMLSDAQAIKDFQNGKKELSLGYTSNLEWRAGETPQGEKYDAVQTTIRINHLAVVDAARGGPKLAIGDSTVAPCQEAIEKAKKLIADGRVDFTTTFDASKAQNPLMFMGGGEGHSKYPFTSNDKVYRKALESIKAQAATNQHDALVPSVDELLNLIDGKKRSPKMDTKMTQITIDGVNLEISDIAASVVLRRVKGLEAEANDLHSKLAAAAAKAKKDSEELESEKEKAKKKMEEDAATIATLTKQLEDAKITPAKLDAMVKDRSEVIGKARAVIGDKLIVDGKTIHEIRQQVVDSKLGDTAKGWNEDQINASFATFTADVKVEDQKSPADSMRRSFSGQPTNVADSKVYDAYDKRLSEAYKQPAA